MRLQPRWSRWCASGGHPASGIPAGEIKPLRSATIDLNGVIATFPPALDTEVKAILDALEAEKSRH